MKKTMVGGLVGGVILFVWSFMAWVILPLHEPSLHKIPNEDAVISALQSNLDAKAVYLFPRSPGLRAEQPAMEAWTEKAKRGPVGMIIYNPMGMNPMMPSQMVVGLILNIATALIIAWFLSRSTAFASSYLSRVSYCGMFAIFTSAYTHLMAWNWMGYPTDYTSSLIIDGVVGCLLAGLGIAAIVKAEKTQSA